MKITGKEIFLIIALVLIAVYSLAYYNFTGFKGMIDRMNENLQGFAEKYGYLGLFLVSVLGAATILIVIPYPAFVFILASAGLNPLLLGMVSGAGAALGEVIAYLIGVGGNKLLREDDRKKFSHLEAFISRKPRLIPFIIFLFGATPLPDDIVFIPLGFMKYGFKKAFIPNFLGKMAMLLSVAYFGKFSLDYFKIGLVSEGGFIGQIITLVFTVAVLYAVLKINWVKLIGEKNA